MDTVRYTGKNTDAGPSPAIWANCPWLEAINDPNVGYGWWDDFLGAPTMASATAQGPYFTYQDTGVTIAPLETVDEVGGVIEIANNDADNDEGSICLGSSLLANQFKIADAGTRVWFEARLKLAAVTDNGVAIFIGLAEEGVTAANALADTTGEVADKDFVGWHSLAADGNALIGFHRINGGAVTAVSGASEAIVADTYFKAGFYFDGSTLTYHFNGVAQGTVTDVSAATFPDGEELTMALATKVGSAAEVAVQMDWWRCFQER